MGLTVRPLTLKQANEAVSRWHRHHKPDRGHRFSLACYDGDRICGAVIVGRPKARALDQYRIAEVTRLVTDGTKNACSILYAAAARACQAMGFDRIQTYILQTEPGTSLKASGWVCDGVVRKDGKGWNNRPNRRTDQPTDTKVRWRKQFREGS